MTKSKLVLTLIGFSLIAVTSRADRREEVLAEMAKAGDSLKTLTADFEQTDHDHILGDQEVSTGELYLSVPGRIRWEYAPPRERVLVVKDELVRLYNPTANQVHEFRQGSGKGKTGGADLLIGFGKSNEKIGETYDVTLVEETNEAVVLSLVPKPDASSLFTKIELTVDKKTWRPVRSVFHEPNRDRTDVQFENMVANGSLPSGVFELKLPANVEIIRN
ncbi:MAG: LolA family protein [Vicinamibacteria bacterium]